MIYLCWLYYLIHENLLLGHGQSSSQVCQLTASAQIDCHITAVSRAYQVTSYTVLQESFKINMHTPAPSVPRNQSPHPSYLAH
jgi:hypothetical protein